MPLRMNSSSTHQDPALGEHEAVPEASTGGLRQRGVLVEDRLGRANGDGNAPPPSVSAHLCECSWAVFVFLCPCSLCS